MYVPDAALEDLRTFGYTIVEGFLAAEELSRAREALWDEFPRPEDYFADPDRHPEIRSGQFGGLKPHPFRSFAHNQLTFHPDLVHAAERYLGTTELALVNLQLWAKYAGSVEYAQPHHRDYPYCSLVVPRADGWDVQLFAYVFLSDVDEDCGPTTLVPYPVGREDPYSPVFKDVGSYAGEEVRATGPAGSLFLHRSDLLHRGSSMTGERASRFLVRADFQRSDVRWCGSVCHPAVASNAAFGEMLERATPRQRELFGFPSVGHPYWNEQTVADVGVRYPGMDMSPYRA